MAHQGMIAQNVQALKNTIDIRSVAAKLRSIYSL